MRKLSFGSLDLWSQKTVFLMCLWFKLMVLSLTENNIIFIFMLWSPLKAEYALRLANLVVATI